MKASPRGLLFCTTSSSGMQCLLYFIASHTRQAFCCCRREWESTCANLGSAFALEHNVNKIHTSVLRSANAGFSSHFQDPNKGKVRLLCHGGGNLPYYLRLQGKGSWKGSGKLAAKVRAKEKKERRCLLRTSRQRSRKRRRRRGACCKVGGSAVPQVQRVRALC